MKFKSVIPVWTEYKKRMVKESTMAAYILSLQKHILPAFGEWEIKDMTKKNIKPEILSWLDTKGLSKKTIADHLIVIKMILDFACNEMEVENVPNSHWKMEWPTVNVGNSEKIERFDKEQLAVLVSYCENYPSAKNLAILLVCCTGIRIGEICGLRWEDIDVQNRCFTIRRTLERIYEIDSRNNKGKTKLIMGEPKTLTSRRTLPLMPNIFNLVKDFYDISRPDYYVASGAMRPIEPRTFREYYKKTIKALGLPIIKFHGLRHTFASTLVESGVDVKTVSTLLGHADISTTLNLYCHPTAAGKAKAIESGLSKVFVKRKKNQKPWN